MAAADRHALVVTALTAPLRMDRHVDIRFPDPWPASAVEPLDAAVSAELAAALADPHPPAPPTKYLENNTHNSSHKARNVADLTDLADGKLDMSKLPYSSHPFAAASKVHLTWDYYFSLPVDAVTVAANECLQGGGGQDELMHKFAGPSLRKETATFPARAAGTFYGGLAIRCLPGEAVVSHGHALPIPYIIHAVPPYLDDDGSPNVAHLVSCYRHILSCIDGVHIRKVAISPMGTGFYGFPQLAATILAMRSVREWLQVPGNAEKCDAIYFWATSDVHYRMHELLMPVIFPVPSSDAAPESSGGSTSAASATTGSAPASDASVLPASGGAGSTSSS